MFGLPARALSLTLLIIHVDLLVHELFNFLGMVHVRLSASESVRL